MYSHIIDIISKLEDDWDGEGSLTASKSTIDLAIKLSEELQNKKEVPPIITRIINNDLVL